MCTEGSAAAAVPAPVAPAAPRAAGPGGPAGAPPNERCPRGCRCAGLQQRQAGKRPGAPRSTGPSLNVPHGRETKTVGRQQAGAAEAVPFSEGYTLAQVFRSLNGMAGPSLLPTSIYKSLPLLSPLDATKDLSLSIASPLTESLRVCLSPKPQLMQQNKEK